jgi:hypothetical protein
MAFIITRTGQLLQLSEHLGININGRLHGPTVTRRRIADKPIFQNAL